MDLKKSASEMSDEELMTLLKDVRQSRRTVKRQVSSAPTKRAPKTEASSVSVDDLIKNLTPEQVAAFLMKGK
jgi:hypothetical protein